MGSLTTFSMGSYQDNSRIQVLIVEDETIIGTDLKARVQNLGYSVCGAVPSGEAALQAAEDMHPDLVLMDIVLAGAMDGIEAADVIRRRWGIPIVFVTAYADEEKLRRARLATPFGYVLKPIDDRDLKVTMEMALRTVDIERARRQAEAALSECQEKWRAATECSSDAVVILQEGKVAYCNPTAQRLMGCNVEDDFFSWVAPEERKEIETYYRRKLEGRTSPDSYRTYLFNRRSQRSYMEMKLRSLRYGGRPGVLAVIRSAGGETGAEREALEEEKTKTIEILHRINSAATTEDLIHIVTDTIRDWLDMEAVGVRLQEGDDFPYYETRGFPKEFVLAENSLCCTDTTGSTICDEAGNPVLECMCGNVLRSRFDPSKPFFTERGAFWTNSTSALLAGTTEADRQARTRNRCHGEGYESVALIPLRSKGETFGLIQLNDSRKNCFSPEIIAFMERVAENIAIALDRQRAEARIKAALAEKEVLIKEIHHRVKNNMQVISSLLNLQARHEKDQYISKALQESQNRVMAMSLAHETIYRSDTLTQITLDQYVRELTTSIACSYGLPAGNITVQVDVSEGIVLNLDKAIPCGLVLNELLSNASKHAFPEGGPGQIEIAGRQTDTGHLLLTVRDNGTGFPEEMDWRSSQTLGLSLVKGLTEGQLGGHVELIRDGGTTFKITFEP